MVRFDTQGGPTTRFGTDHGPIDLTVGRNGFVYTLSGTDTVRKYDRTTLTQVGGDLTLPFVSSGYRSIAVDTDGSIVAGQFGNVLQRFDPSGNLLATLTLTGLGGVADVDINPDTGQIGLATRSTGQVAVVDAALTAVLSSQTISGSGLGGDGFVVWVPVPVPEPTGWLVMAGLLVGAARPARRRLLPATPPSAW